MPSLAMIINLLAIAVFSWLTYQTICTAAATPARCRFLRHLQSEFTDQGFRLTAEVDRLFKQPRNRSQDDVAAALARPTDWPGAVVRAGLPPDYRPAEILYRIAIARLAGDVTLAWDEYRHWLRRVGFGWSERLSYGRQAKEFGLLFTVLGALLAFGNLSQLAKPFEVFGALSLAMLTTIVGLLLSMLASHVLVQRFCVQYRQLQIESEKTVLQVLRHLSRLPSSKRATHHPAVKRKRTTTQTNRRVAPWYQSVTPRTNGAVRCIPK